ncbi:MAG: hypothetical protein QM769_11215 [Pseudoxanthomonas sp.]
MPTRDACDAFRYSGGSEGHYESYFLRANHPARPAAFWLRYTMFCPRGAPERALGELWAVYFDGDAHRIAAARSVVPLAQCSFSEHELAVRIGSASLDQESLQGRAESGPTRIAWQLRYTSPASPLLLLPARMYATRLPKAKALVSSPFAAFDGELQVDGERVSVAGWVGSQNHNWGSQHTDRYAWGQVASFDGAPEAFLECATASLRVGRFLTPPLSPIVLRLGDEEFAWNGLLRSLRTRARYRPFTWHLSAEDARARIEVELDGRAEDFIALPYDNPPGGQKICLNSKLASCRVVLTRPERPPLTLYTRTRAAFEILQDNEIPGIARL